MHGRWRTPPPFTPKVGLRQRCSLSPLVFRWCVENAVAEAHKDWDSNAQGICDDSYLFANNKAHLETMTASIKMHALRCIGLHPWVQK